MHHSYSLADYFKRGHTLSFDGHCTENVEMLRARSAALLPSRGPSYPCTPLDLSADLAAENIMRRTLHSRILERNPDAFHRRCGQESAGALLKQKKELEALLGDLHPDKDTNDIDKSKTLTFSIKRRMEEQAKLTKAERDFQNLAPMEDFIRPKDSSTARSTGYEKGHIRSLLNLDIYGPADSLMAARQRDSGELPLQPNVDRYSDFQPRVGSPAISRASTASSEMEFWQCGSRASTPTASSVSSFGLPNMTSNLSTSSRSYAQSLADTKPLSLRKSTEGVPNTRILPQDRMQVDAFVRRKEFQKSYARRLEDHRQDRQQQREITRALRRKAAIAHAERQAIRDFEKKLVLSKFCTGKS